MLRAHLDKELIKKNFKKSLLTYNNNAIVQKKMALKLLSLLDSNKYSRILEIGSYTGILTSQIFQKINFNHYQAIDIINSKEFIDNIIKNCTDKQLDNPRYNNLREKVSFQECDIESYITNDKFDLIIANASLQWCQDFSLIAQKLKSLLNKQGLIAISIFTNENLLEIKDIFSLSLEYPSIETLAELFLDSRIIVDIEKLKFNNSLEVLRHLKLTGVNSIVKNNFNYIELKNKLKLLEKKYNNCLTYTPLYLLYQA